MSIKKVEIKMVKSCDNVLVKQNKLKYMPIATITYDEESKSVKQIFLDNKLVEKDYFKCWDMGRSFFIGTTDDSYIVYDEDGNRTATLLIERCGRLIQIDFDYFVCLRGDWLDFIDVNGFAFRGTLLSKDEINALTT